MSDKIFQLMVSNQFPVDWWHDPLIKRLVFIVTSTMKSEEYMHLILRHLYSRWRDLRVNTDMLMDLTTGRFEGIPIFTLEKSDFRQELMDIRKNLRITWVPRYKKLQEINLFS